MGYRWDISRFRSGINSFQDGMFKMHMEDEARNRRHALLRYLVLVYITLE